MDLSANNARESMLGSREVATLLGCSQRQARMLMERTNASGSDRWKLEDCPLRTRGVGRHSDKQG